MTVCASEVHVNERDGEGRSDCEGVGKLTSVDHIILLLSLCGQGEVPVAMETAAGEGTGEGEAAGTGGEGDEGVEVEETKAKEEPRLGTDG